MIRATYSGRGVERLARRRADVPQAVSRSMNRAAASAVTAISRAVATDMRVQQRRVRDAVHVQPAQPTRLVVAVFASAKRLPLIAFGARGPEPSRGRGSGVRATTPARRYPHAFIATMKSGHRGVFERKEKSRSRKKLKPGSPGLPIVELFGAINRARVCEVHRCRPRALPRAVPEGAARQSQALHVEVTLMDSYVVLEVRTERLAEQAIVTIDGEPYRLKHPDTLPLHEALPLARFQASLAFVDEAALDDAARLVLDRQLDRVVALVLEAPAEILVKLSALQRMAIMAAVADLPAVTRRLRPAQE